MLIQSVIPALSHATIAAVEPQLKGATVIIAQSLP